MASVCIALGSNVEPEKHLTEAALRLEALLDHCRWSPVYQTPPWGYTNQEDFLNAVLVAETRLPPLALLSAMLGIETLLGRVRSIPNGPRTLDLDLLFYDELIQSSSRLHLPHPGLHERAFVLVPLCRIDGERKHPRLGKSMNALLEQVDQSGIAPHPLQLGRSQ